MLFTCPGAAARGGGPSSYRGGRRDLCVDIHCHVHVPAADEMVKHLVTPDREPAGRFSNALSRETNRKQMENVRESPDLRGNTAARHGQDGHGRPGHLALALPLHVLAAGRCRDQDEPGW